MAVTTTTLDEPQARALVPALTAILADAVAGGASVGFMTWQGEEPFRRYWEGVADDVGAGRIVLLAASDGDRVLGTGQLHLIGKANQPHRAEIAKVLVHSSARRRGVGAALMLALEAEALAAGRDLLVLDTDADSAARRLYAALGWTEAGTIPRYALMPDGRDCASTFFFKSLR